MATAIVIFILIFLILQEVKGLITTRNCDALPSLIPKNRVKIQFMTTHLAYNTLYSRQSTSLSFKKGQSDSDSGVDQGPSNNVGRGQRIIKAVKRIIGSIIPKPDPGNRFHLRLLNPSLANKRHATTRIMRYLPVP